MKYGMLSLTVLTAACVGGVQSSSVAAQPAAPVVAAATPVEPPEAFQICMACHTVSDDGAPGMGPNLRGVVGRKSAASKAFAYSAAVKKLNVVWTPENIDKWLQNPAAMAPGTQMYQAVPAPEDRAAIIKYLASLK